MRKTIEQIIQKKKDNQKITMLTAYDYPMASILDKVGIDIVLVGDSLSNVALGFESTRDVGMTEMIHHAKAVNRAVNNALLVGDMPYESYQTDVGQALSNAKRFVEEAGCNAVKVEWFDHCLDAVDQIVSAEIPVMGHIGLTPQTVEKLGGYKVQGKDSESAKTLMDNAKALEERGCFCVVLECVPEMVGKLITEVLNIPTISIGAGRFCDGQVLVTNDLLGFAGKFEPKFVKKYAHLNEIITESIDAFKNDVSSGEFPGDSHTYSINEEELQKLKKYCLKPIQ